MFSWTQNLLTSHARSEIYQAPYQEPASGCNAIAALRDPGGQGLPSMSLAGQTPIKHQRKDHATCLYSVSSVTVGTQISISSTLITKRLKMDSALDSTELT